MRPLLRRARELGAHLHVDMESVDSLRDERPSSCSELLAEDEFADGPVCGRRAPGVPARLAQPARAPARRGRAASRGARRRSSIRLVKGAYWDHEVVEARQHGWAAPVFEDKADCDRNFEALTRTLLDARPLVRVEDRLPQPALGRPRDRLQPRRPAATMRPRAPGPARARRRAGRGAARRAAAGAQLLPGRRPRRRDGLPGPPPAREHLERPLPATPIRAGRRSRSCWQRHERDPTHFATSRRSSCAAQRAASA